MEKVETEKVQNMIWLKNNKNFTMERRSLQKGPEWVP